MSAAFPPWLVGHRGARAVETENSLAGFRWAREQGLAAVELDVRVTRDGVAVCSHDATLSRVFGRDVAVADAAASELPELPTLEAALAELAGVGVIVELKQQAGADTAAVVAPLLGTNVVAISSFSAPLVDAMRAAAPAFADRCAQLHTSRTVGSFSLARVRARGLGHAHYHWLTLLREPWLCRAAHACAIEVAAYTVNDARTAAALRVLGCDFVITDDPRLWTNTRT